ncbi:MAG: preprotein translocase subunit SecA [Patescibacteria group bacterium]
MLSKIIQLFSADSSHHKTVEQINALEEGVVSLSDDALRAKSKELQTKARSYTSWEEQSAYLEQILPEAFALVREAAKRTLHQRHFDAQLLGGIALHKGQIAEMRTGEGKTLAATLAVYLNALAGHGVHVVTVNEYLAKRDATWMGQIYAFLGLTTSCLVHEGARQYDPHFKKGESDSFREGGAIDEVRDRTGSFMVHDEYLRPISRKDAYATDITYGTNHEFGFDYLRDNLAYRKEDQVQGAHHYAVIDEVDSILIDEARTPLIIAAPDAASSDAYKAFARVVSRLKRDEDYIVDEKLRSVDIIEAGIDSVEKVLNISNLYSPENLRMTHYLQESLKAKELFLNDRDYVVKDGQIIIVDQFTGRLMKGRRYSGGLHQAIEAKEGVHVREESRTYASISIQNYFRLYRKISGMTGTAQTSAEEFDKVYSLKVVTIPTHKAPQRADEQDLVYKTVEGKYQAIVRDIKARHEKGQPILIGTVSIEKNEELARHLRNAGLKHEVLNAKNNEHEGGTIAQAGRPGAITVATNMAGRGVDIILGGNPSTPEAAQKVKEAGGLHVVGTERHESRRIDNQLRGRAGRQGDPGSSQFFLSLQDDLMRIFGGDRVSGIMDRFNIPEDQPIQAKLVTRSISQAQSKVEGMHFDSRKHLLEYDDVLNKQRLSIYKKRQELLDSGSHPQMLSVLDMFWMSHLENMEELQDGVGLRAYGQHDPLVEYRKEGHVMFQAMLREFEKWIEENKDKLEVASSSQQTVHMHAPAVNGPSSGVDDSNVGRNDPCPCGSGKKYKKCHGK